MAATAATMEEEKDAEEEAPLATVEDKDELKEEAPREDMAEALSDNSDASGGLEKNRPFTNFAAPETTPVQREPTSGARRSMCHRPKSKRTETNLCV